MTKFFFTTILLYAFHIYGFGQTVIKGSYLIVAPCKEGIVMGEDSRMSYVHMSNEKEVSFSMDTMQKIFPMKRFIIGLIGNVSFRDDSILASKIILDYVEHIKESNTNVQSIQLFKGFVDNNYPKVSGEFFKNIIVCAAYVGNQPTIFIRDSISGWKIENNGGYYTPTINKYFDKHYNFNLTSQKLAALIEKSIRIYAKENHKEKEIGGPIMVLNIASDNTVSWLKNKPTKKSRIDGW